MSFVHAFDFWKLMERLLLPWCLCVLALGIGINLLPLPARGVYRIPFEHISSGPVGGRSGPGFQGWLFLEMHSFHQIAAWTARGIHSLLVITSVQVTRT